LAGNLVSTIFDSDAIKNQKYKADFDGSLLPAGVYMYKLFSDKDILTGKMIMIKM